LFEATTKTNQRGRRSPAAGVLSLVLHALLAFFVVTVLMKAKQVVAPPPDLEVTFFSAPPPPPPPPPKAAKKKKKKKKKKEPIVEPIPQELVQPEEIPEEIPETEEEEVEEDEELADAGVEGGVEGGVAGGQVDGTGKNTHDFGVGESRGLCVKKPPARYPDMAKEMNIEGTVRVRLLIGVDGKIVKAKDERCTEWHTTSKKDRRRNWHPRLCVEATTGPEALIYETLTAWGTSKWRPWQSGNVNTNYYANVEVNYQLK